MGGPDFLQGAVNSYPELKEKFPLFDAAIEATRHYAAKPSAILREVAINARLNAGAYTDVSEGRFFTLSLQENQSVMTEGRHGLHNYGPISPRYVGHRVVGNRIDMATTPPFGDNYIYFSTLHPETFERDQPHVFIRLVMKGVQLNIAVRNHRKLYEESGLVVPSLLIRDLD